MNPRLRLFRVLMACGMASMLALPVRADDESACNDLDFDGDGWGGYESDFDAGFGLGADPYGLGSMAGWNYGISQFAGGCTKTPFIMDDPRLTNVGDDIVGTPYEPEDTNEANVPTQDGEDPTPGDEPTTNTEGDEETTTDTKDPCSKNPVQLATGFKVESAIDMIVKLPNRDFTLTRSYSSGVVGDRGLVGAGWTLSAFQYISPGAGNTLSLRGGTANSASAFTFDSASSRWLPSGSSDEYIVATTLSAQGRTRNVYRHVRPGKGTVDYYRAGGGTPAALVGMVAEDRDLHGGRWMYDYTLFGIANPTARLRRVRFYSAGQNEFQTPMGEVRFGWFMLTPMANDYSNRNGKLNFAVAVRFDALGAATVVGKVQYLYYHFPFDAWIAPGSGGGGGGGGGGAPRRDGHWIDPRRHGFAWGFEHAYVHARA